MSDDTAPAPQEPADAAATESAEHAAATEFAEDAAATESAAPDAAEPTEGAAGEPEGSCMDRPRRRHRPSAHAAHPRGSWKARRAAGAPRTVSAAYQKQTEEVEQVRKRLERQAAIKEVMRRGEVVVALDPVRKRSIEAAAKGATRTTPSAA